MPRAAGCDVPLTMTRVATTTGGGRSEDARNSYEPDRPVILNDQSALTAAAIAVPPANRPSALFAVIRNPIGVVTAPAGTTTTWPVTDAPVLTVSKRSRS